MRKAGVEKSLLEQAITQLRGGQQVNEQSAEEQRQALEKYTIDLTAQAVKNENRNEIFRCLCNAFC